MHNDSSTYNDDSSQEVTRLNEQLEFNRIHTNQYINFKVDLLGLFV